MAAFLLATTALPVSAQELPAVDRLRPIFEEGLPGYWGVNDFRVVSSAAGGDPVNPLALFRFEADVSPSADLFSATGEDIGPFTVVVPTYSGTQVRTIYGTMQLAYHAGEWEGGADLENPVDELGVPLDVFRRPPLISGSPELATALAQLRGDAVAKAKSELSAELNALQAEHKAEIDGLVAGHAANLSAKQREYEAKLSDLSGQLEPTLAAEKAKLDEELESMRTAHAAKIGALKAEQAEVVAEFEAGLTARRERLERQLAEAQSVIDAQEALIKRISAAASNDEAIRAAFEVKRADQLELFQSFGAELFGNLRCVSIEDEEHVTDFPLYFEITTVTSTGIDGLMRSQRGSDNTSPATLTLAGTAEDGATDLILSLNWRNIPGTYVLRQNENGSLVGGGEGQMHVSGARSDQAVCDVVLATR